MRKILVLIFSFLLSASWAFAEVSIETSVSRSRLPVGEQLVLDIIIANADGKIEKPIISSVDGFTSYSQGHSQEFSIINGRSSSRSIFSYVLVANAVGQKTIGPFSVVIGGKEYKIAAVKVEVSQASASTGYTWAQAPATTPSPRAMPSSNVGDQDIFVKAWLDKDEVYVNEPVMMTYTLFTRLSATYKGFEKEPVTTGFWVEDFPPEKTIRRTEQFLNGQRYVVADVRKLALFPTQSGAYTVDPGVLAATVELQSQDNFQSFFSGNVFGGRRMGFPSGFATEVINKSLSPDSVRIIAKTLPENGKPKDFSGSVGRFSIESSMDKDQVEVGDPVTLRMKISGRGNINTVKNPPLPKMENFKVYDSSSSTNTSKERLVVEGERITETVIVPRRPGTYIIPSTSFSFFDPEAGEYRTVKTEAHTLKVSGMAGESDTSTATSSTSSSDEGLEPAAKEEVDFVAKDIRYIKTSPGGVNIPSKNALWDPVTWTVNVLLIVIAALFAFLSGQKSVNFSDSRSFRMRRSHSVARNRLKQSSQWMKQGKHDDFYREISHAVLGYFADKFDVPEQGITQQRIEELAGEKITSEALNKIKKLFDEMSVGRFAQWKKDTEHMKEVYDLADEVITSFEKVKMK